MTTTQVKRALVVEMETVATVASKQKAVAEDSDQKRALLTCGPVPGEELSYVDLAELLQPLAELPDLFRCHSSKPTAYNVTISTMIMVVQERVISILEQLRTLSTLVYTLLQPTLGT